MVSEFEMLSPVMSSTISLGKVDFAISRPHSFGVVIEGLAEASDDRSDDYLHHILLAPENREEFIDLIEKERLVVCKHVRSDAPSYRKVRGKSSAVKLSQAEYYHHDGCSSPTKPRLVEIRCPYQAVARNIATAIAMFPSVIRAMLLALPEASRSDDEIRVLCDTFSGPVSSYPCPTTWDAVQGKLTRLVRRELDAEACRAYYRRVDQLANAYDSPWEMGESRLMLNDHQDLTKTMQHRRAYQKPRESTEQNGSLVKRWTAEEA
jgi:hypothetical protein